MKAHIRNAVVGVVAIGALAVGMRGLAVAACGQFDTCNSGNLCLFTGDNYTGRVLNVAGSNPTLNFNNCDSSCDCLCFNDLTQSARNNSSFDSHRLWSETGYSGNTICLTAGQQITGSAGMGSLYMHVRSEENGCF